MAEKGKGKKTVKAHTYYGVSSEKVERKNKMCPKCGDGVFLANHKDRLFCGKCNYTEKIKA